MLLFSASAKNSATMSQAGGHQTLVAPRSAPCHCLVDVLGGVGLHQSLGLAIGLLVLAQRDALLDHHVSAAPVCGSVPLWSWMRGAHIGIPECFVEPLLHALVTDNFVQFRVPAGFNESIPARRARHNTAR